MNKNVAIQNPENVCFHCLQQKDEGEIHKIHIPEMGYGSGFDGWSSTIQLCDECYQHTNPEWWKLKEVPLEKTGTWSEFFEYEFEKAIFEFINQLPLAGQELFWNRFSDGWNSGITWDAQDWIDYKLGILPHEKCKEYHVYSPEEINAYQERFPICQHPVNKLYNDGSKGCWCPFGAHGEYGQKCGINISDECYQCEYFKKRKTPIVDITEENYEEYKLWLKAKIKYFDKIFYGIFDEINRITK